MLMIENIKQTSKNRKTAQYMEVTGNVLGTGCNILQFFTYSTYIIIYKHSIMCQKFVTK
jgi:hypothetical protein